MNRVGALRDTGLLCRLRRSRLGQVLLRVPFYLLIAILFVYALFPFYWVLRSSTVVEDVLARAGRAWIGG